MASSSASSSGGSSPGAHDLREPADAGCMGAVGEDLGQPGDEVGQVGGVAALGPAGELDARRCRGGPAPCGGGATAPSPPPGTRRAWRARRPCCGWGGRPGSSGSSSVGEVRGHADERTPRVPTAERPAGSVRGMRRTTHSPWPPPAPLSIALVGLRRLRRRPAAATPADVGADRQGRGRLKFDADSYTADAGCIEVDLRERRQHRPHLARRGRAGFKLSIGDDGHGHRRPAGRHLHAVLRRGRPPSAGMEAELVTSAERRSGREEELPAHEADHGQQDEAADDRVLVLVEGQLVERRCRCRR